MSASASFWAAKSNGVKSPHARTEVAKPAVQIEPPMTSATLMKGIPSGVQLQASADQPRGHTNSVKKIDWADSDDDEEFIASFTSTGRIQELKEALIAKEGHINDLSTSLQKKDDRIAELESALQKQNLRSIELEETMGACTAQVEELTQENHKQALLVQQLVADVEEKDRCIAAFEAEIDERCATIAELDVTDDSTQMSSNGGAEAREISSTDITSSETEAKNEQVESSQQTPQHLVEQEPINSTAVVSSAETPFTTAIGPAVNLAAFPVFVTAATLKQTAPPPPAPKLKMPIDLSKFSKKVTTKPVAPKNKSGSSPLVSKKNGPAPQINPSSDIRTKSYEERILFANGLKVEVKMGETVLATLPKYVLMQCSSKAFKYFSENPDVSSFHVPAGSMDAAAAKAHLEWMHDMTYQGRVYSITLNSDERFDDKNLQICRAARVLGLNNMYVGHFTKIFCDRIRSNAASDSFLSKVAAAAYPGNDPIYDCLANNLANSRLRKAVKNSAALDALLQSNEDLKIKVEKIEARMRKKRDGTELTKEPDVAHVEKKMDV